MSDEDPGGRKRRQVEKRVDAMDENTQVYRTVIIEDLNGRDLRIK